MEEGIKVLLIFLGLSTPIIVVGLVYYFKKRLEHKQILAAIEKGTPLSDLVSIKPAKPIGPLWIKNLTAGIALLVIATGLVGIQFLVGGYDYGESRIFLLIAVVLFALGVSRILRGVLQRRVEKEISPQIQPSQQNTSGVSTSQTPQQTNV